MKAAIDIRWSVTCSCGWTYSNGIKSDVEQQVRWHRDHHRLEGNPK